MRQRGTAGLFQYWNRLRDGRPAPRRSEIEPADIKSMLADTFILERDLRGDAVFRLAGTRLCATFGRELKGFAFTSLWGHADQSKASRLALATLLDKSVSVTTLLGTTASGRSIDLELLLLPLEGGAESSRAMGSLCPAEKPYWLGADPIVQCEVDGVRMIDPDRESRLGDGLLHVTAPPLAPGQASIDDAPTRRFRHLVVIDGGRRG
ncbi:PAS domain-containing protein [Aquibium carbonis]|uniref:PAS domain-containing protein n=1 Tax=Aquibium carbonis TaxID=2495581 RepID=A0A429YVU5_9HYPH|nr:PAS domain-containing protein [Aquibium carbonis]RST85522.1 PAS domain-containing protein [Aquibium carbonis]